MTCAEIRLIASGTEKDSNKAIPELFAPDSDPYGLAYSEWTVRWWQWCLS